MSGSLCRWPEREEETAPREKCTQSGQSELAGVEVPEKQVSQNAATQDLAEMQTLIL